VPLRSLLLAVVITGVIVSMTDWLFSGDWLHNYYNRHREVWRHPGGVGEWRAIAWASAWPFVTAAAFAAVVDHFAIRGLSNDLFLAVAMWVMAPLAINVTNALFIKIDPVVVASHTAGWLVRLVVTAIVVWYFTR
jgi:hypothetical protein